MFSSIPRWTPPLIALAILFFIYPKIRNFDRERKITVAVEDMHDDIVIENSTDGKANEVHLLEVKINELLSGTNGSISFNRSGNVTYTLDEDGDVFQAQFFIESLDYSVSVNSITGRCRTKGCVTLYNVDDVDDKRETQEVFILLNSSEQGDRLIELLNEYKQISAKDQKIDTGLNRRFKRFADKWLKLFN